MIRPLGLCESLSMHGTAEREWSDDGNRFDARFVFEQSYLELREALAIARDIARTGDETTKQRVTRLLSRAKTSAEARFQNWQPNAKQLKQPN